MEEVFSLLKGYTDKDGVIHREFELEEIGGAEEEAVSKAEIKNNGAKVIRVLLCRCCTRIGTIERKNVPASKWTEIIQSLDVADQDYMLLKLREISKGTEIEVSHTCSNPECKEKLNTTIETSELEIIPYNGVDIIDFELPVGFIDKEGQRHKFGKLRRPNGLDREILDPIIKKNVGRATTLMLTRCILEVEGMKITDESVRNLKLRDREYLQELLKDNNFGINLTTEIICPVCGEESKGTLNIVNFI